MFKNFFLSTAAISMTLISFNAEAMWQGPEEGKPEKSAASSKLKHKRNKKHKQTSFLKKTNHTSSIPHKYTGNGVSGKNSSAHKNIDGSLDEKCLKAQSSSKESFVKSLLEKGNELLKQRLYSEAHEAFADALDQLSIKDPRYEIAIEQKKKARKPIAAAESINEGNTFIKEGKIAQALTCFNRALSKLDPQDPLYQEATEAVGNINKDSASSTTQITQPAFDEDNSIVHIVEEVSSEVEARAKPSELFLGIIPRDVAHTLILSRLKYPEFKAISLVSKASSWGMKSWWEKMVAVRTTCTSKGSKEDKEAASLIAKLYDLPLNPILGIKGLQNELVKAGTSEKKSIHYFFPESFKYAVKRTELKLKYVELRYVPVCVGEMIRLTELYLNNNQLKEIPECIGRLKNLSTLWINDNQLKSFPDCLWRLPNLSSFWFHNNPIVVFPEDMPESVKKRRGFVKQVKSKVSAKNNNVRHKGSKKSQTQKGQKALDKKRNQKNPGQKKK